MYNQSSFQYFLIPGWLSKLYITWKQDLQIRFLSVLKVFLTHYIFNTGCTDITELTIVAFGTSTPEVAVSIIASLHGQSGMAIGNVICSNIFNVLMFVGFVCYLVHLIQKSRNTTLNADVIASTSEISMYKSIVYSMGGIIAIVIGGKLVVVSASYIALALATI
ncbi:hypothetical protein QOZ83_05145 [Romboutsia sedimentorum]|uniref:hypothetical protein n=1 Tax=Romboutsia sedimentorum TaxID=1368474 RepID=UPI0024DE0395|nr:hypothetical protein [Romboutsia sedimentorum]MDK2585241.1 hypothetical protein [Romboutsia sedimentorum]